MLLFDRDRVSAPARRIPGSQRLSCLLQKLRSLLFQRRDVFVLKSHGDAPQLDVEIVKVHSVVSGNGDDLDEADA
jgi:hypothetical protein